MLRIEDGDEPDPAAGHVFISYARDDAAEVDRLQQRLEAAGIRVWRDTADLWPGEDWAAKIRQAITDDALVFVACFSSRSIARERTYQNQEVRLAVEQMRLRVPGEPWLIPVRLDDCEIPAFDIGGGRTLNAIQRADLFGPRSGENTARLIGAVERILGRRPGVGRQAAVRPSSRDPRGDEDVLVVAAGFAYKKQYLALSAYACQPRRSFREVTRIAFYADGAIKEHVAQIRYREYAVMFTEQEAAMRRGGTAADRHVAEVITASLRNGSWLAGTTGQIFLLSGPQDPETIRLGQPIRNDAVSRSGRPCAWVQGQRYVSLAALTRPDARVTSDLDSA